VLRWHPSTLFPISYSTRRDTAVRTRYYIVVVILAVLLRQTAGYALRHAQNLRWVAGIRAGDDGRRAWAGKRLPRCCRGRRETRTAAVEARRGRRARAVLPPSTTYERWALTELTTYLTTSRWTFAVCMPRLLPRWRGVGCFTPGFCMVRCGVACCLRAFPRTAGYQLRLVPWWFGLFTDARTRLCGAVSPVVAPVRYSRHGFSSHLCSWLYLCVNSGHGGAGVRRVVCAG